MQFEVWVSAAAICREGGGLLQNVGSQKPVPKKAFCPRWRTTLTDTDSVECVTSGVGTVVWQQTNMDGIFAE